MAGFLLLALFLAPAGAIVLNKWYLEATPELMRNIADASERLLYRKRAAVFPIAAHRRLPSRAIAHRTMRRLCIAKIS